MSAADDIRRMSQRFEVASLDVLVGVATEAHRSITKGHDLTGAPGQPVDTGYLLGSWQLTFPSKDSASIATNASYAQAVEDGVGPHGPVAYGAQGHGRSTVGGSHSVALTLLNLGRIVDAETAKVRGAT